MGREEVGLGREGSELGRSSKREALAVQRKGATTACRPTEGRVLRSDHVTASGTRRHEEDTCGDLRVWGGQEVLGEQRERERHTFGEQRGWKGHTFGEQRGGKVIPLVSREGGKVIPLVSREGGRSYLW